MIDDFKEQQFCHAWISFSNRVAMLKLHDTDVETLCRSTGQLLEKWGWSYDSDGIYRKREDMTIEAELERIQAELEAEFGPMPVIDYGKVDELLARCGECIAEFRKKAETEHYWMPDEDWRHFLKWAIDNSESATADCNDIALAWDKWRTHSIDEALQPLLEETSDEK